MTECSWRYAYKGIIPQDYLDAVAEGRCEIVKHIAVLAENERGFTKEITLDSWDEEEQKYDIRTWHPGREKSGKGVTLTRSELQNLVEALEIELEDGREI